MLPFQARVDLGAMAMKGCSALLEAHHHIVWCHIRETHWKGSYSSAELQSVYSTAPTGWAINRDKSGKYGVWFTCTKLVINLTSVNIRQLKLV